MTSTLHDAVPPLEQLGELSRHHAQQGDLRLAQLAAWASDVHLLEALLWENGLGEAPDPDAQLAAVGDAVAASLQARADEVGDGLTAREVVEVAREALLSTFDESVHALVLERLLPLGHLDQEPAQDQDLDENPAVPREPTARERLEGRTPGHLVAELRATAADCMAVAELMADEGEDAAALRMARQADAASFEAYLTTAAVLAGDDRLATVDLRWELARRVELHQGAATTDLTEVVAVGRNRLSSLLGSAEQAALRETFEPLSEV